MNLSARFDKILRDIWDNKPRSLLVIFTLAIGVAAVGMIYNTVHMMRRDMFGQYAARNPAHLALYISPFPEKLAQDVEAMREVAEAEALRSVSAFTYDSQGARKDLNLLASPNFAEVKINRFVVEKGAGVPSLRGILIERNAAHRLNLQVGNPLLVETGGGKRYTLTVDGIVHDMTVQPYSITAEVQGYVTMSTLEWMGEQPYYNQLLLVVTDAYRDAAGALQVGGLARDRVIEPGGYLVGAMQVRGDPNPGDFWARKQVDGVLLVLQVMSVLGILLSVGLVINTISAVLVQQTRQIGVMRSIGATRRQIAQMYLAYVLTLSLAGLAVALPLGLAGAVGLLAIASDFLNFNISQVNLPPDVLLLQVSLGLAMPLAAALIPILRSSRLSVYDAIYQNGLGGSEPEKGWLLRQLARLRAITPPISLSLRNTFRNKSRLGFTLATLTIAGAMFMAVFSSYTTIRRQIDELGRYIAFDASLSIPGGANKYTVEREALRIPNVKVAEGWASANGVIVHTDGQESDRIEFVGLPLNSQTIQPRLVQGRWLQAGDNGKVVVNEDLLAKEPQLQVGSAVEIKINGQKRTLEVVGIVSKHMSGARIYMDYDQLSRLTGRRNQVDSVRVLATPGVFSQPAEQGAIGKKLEKRFEDAQLSQSSSRTRHEIFDAMSNAFNILLIILLFVAVILAVIGGLGLTGALGLNILERTREIGILRAVGASHRSVRQVVVVEGTVVALLSWIFSALISYPVGRLLSEAVVSVAFDTRPTFQYSFAGLGVWLVVVVLIGVLASLAPARDAVRLTVREVLNYE
ncbi:MAG: ABC transporter permease [Anaerolineales bacterium]|nr:ABC transporter permease [Anaerolineales bacterium]